MGAAALGDMESIFRIQIRRTKVRQYQTLEEVGRMIDEKLYVIGNIDATIIAQRPKMAPHIEQMREKMAEALHIEGGSGEHQGNDRRRTWFYWNGRRDFFTGNCKSGYDC